MEFSKMQRVTKRCEKCWNINKMGGKKINAIFFNLLYFFVPLEAGLVNKSTPATLPFQILNEINGSNNF